jgi:beta-lactamase class C
MLLGAAVETDATIFEIDSVSKTLTATLATYAEAVEKLQLSDRVASYLPELADTDFGRLRLYHLVRTPLTGYRCKYRTRLVQHPHARATSRSAI